MGKSAEVKWLAAPEEHDYPAAESYLSLIFQGDVAKAQAANLRLAPIVLFKAKDIFRASGLTLLGVSNSHVAKDQRKIESGHDLSPLLVVRDPSGGRVIIADGYHRLCAVYSIDEDALILCKIV